jgi:RNA polymerase sigma-70 factor (ECF subfamily)
MGTEDGFEHFLLVVQTSAPIAALVVPQVQMSTSPITADMQAIKNGDRTAFRRIVAAYQSEITAYCIRFLGDEELARDQAQEVFLTLWKERDSYREEGKLRFYLLRIARLRCLASAKKRRSFFALRENYRAQQASVPTDLRPHAAQEDAEVVERCLTRLKPELADLIILRHLEGLDIAEIREVTGLREGTIKSRLSRGLAALKTEVSRHD